VARSSLNSPLELPTQTPDSNWSAAPMKRGSGELELGVGSWEKLYGEVISQLKLPTPDRSAAPMKRGSSQLELGVRSWERLRGEGISQLPTQTPYSNS
jgi:hypothetical protein